ncbi:mCG54146 [Mus musculus]|nr:mCG54146 [Mus musculus]
MASIYTLPTKGCTIIFSIIQSQYSIFRFFDSLTLVASEKIMFHGPAQDALKSFRSAGMVISCYESFFIHRICKPEQGKSGMQT